MDRAILAGALSMTWEPNRDISTIWIVFVACLAYANYRSVFVPDSVVCLLVWPSSSDFTSIFTTDALREYR